MSNFSKPIKIPEWADTGVIVEPSEAKKDSGWVAPELPPDTFFNWWQNLTGNWIKWFDERMADGGGGSTEFALLNPDTGQEVLTIMTVSGEQRAMQFFADANVTYRKVGSDLVWGLDAGDSITFEQGANRYRIEIGSTDLFILETLGLRLAGPMIAASSGLGPDVANLQILRLGSPNNAAFDGEAWFGWKASGTEGVLTLNDALGVAVEATSGRLELSHGGTPSFVGAAGSDAAQLPGAVSLNGGVSIASSPSIIPVSGFLKIQNDDFRITGPSGLPGGTIYWNFSNDDYLSFRDSTKAYEWVFGGVLRMQFLEDKFVDEGPGDIDFGSHATPVTGEYFNRIYAQEFIPSNALAFAASPGNPGNPVQRIRAQTAPFLICAMSSSGVTPINLTHNVASTLRIALGQYTITPWVATSWPRGNIFVTPHSSSLTVGYGHGAFVGGVVAIVLRTTTVNFLDVDHSVIVYDGGWVV